MSNNRLTPEIVFAAFKTVSPNKDFESEKERRWREHNRLVKTFPTLGSGEIYRELVMVVFYSGMNAETVTAKRQTILKFLGDYKEVAAYTEDDVLHICSISDMIKNRAKVRACIKNAKEFLKIDKQFGSFRNYLLSFNQRFPADYSRVPELLDDLQKRFKFLKARTSRHFLMVLGFPIIKPDRMVMRLLFRLGLISGESDEHIGDAVDVSLKAAEEVGIPAGMMDYILVGIGQSEGAKLCKKDKPLCQLCGLTTYCNYVADRQL